MMHEGDAYMAGDPKRKNEKKKNKQYTKTVYGETRKCFCLGL